MPAAITDHAAVFVFVGKIDGIIAPKSSSFLNKHNPRQAFHAVASQTTADPNMPDDGSTAERCMLAKHAG